MELSKAASCGLAAGGALLVGFSLGRCLHPAASNSSAPKEAAAPIAPAAPIVPVAPTAVTRDVVVPAAPPAPVTEKKVSKPAVATKLIDGKSIAQQVRDELKEAADHLEKEHGVRPGLGVIVVGTRTDSATYVKMKKKAAMEAGFHSVDVSLLETVSEAELLAEVKKLNEDPKVHAILVQLPLPAHIDEPKVLKEIKVEKDADGFAALNVGNLCLKGGDPPLAIPCTPAGCIELIQREGIEVKGKVAVVLGRSNIVGMPLAALLQSMDATVTVCHSRTKDIEEHVRRADIVVAAMGKMEFVRGDWLKPGCCVIDVGINSKEDTSKKSGFRLVGDVCFEEAQGIAAQITPVPGGVGPMTIAMLLKNTVNLTRYSLGLPRMPLRKTSVPDKVVKPVAAAAPAAASAAAPAAASAAAPAAAGAAGLKPGDYAVVVSGPKAKDVWADAVKAGELRERVQSASHGTVLPSVVVEVGTGVGDAVQLVGINADGSREKVASGASFADIAVTAA